MARGSYRDMGCGFGVGVSSVLGVNDGYAICRGGATFLGRCWGLCLGALREAPDGWSFVPGVRHELLRRHGCPIIPRARYVIPSMNLHPTRDWELTGLDLKACLCSWAMWELRVVASMVASV
jgi:hypothetical protein